MSYLTGGASTQSRANRPLPPGWDVAAVKRWGCSEEWLVTCGDRQWEHLIDVTWTFCQGGPVLGYTGKRNPHVRTVLQVVAKAEAEGMLGPTSVVSFLERQAAEKLVELVGPHVGSPRDGKLVRWLGNGSDACDCAVRLARAYTGRTPFISIGYHGSSQLFAHKPQDAGVPGDITKWRTDVGFGDSHALAVEMTAVNQACVIVEVPSEDEDAQSFLRYCRELCDRTGTLLVFDEVVTGFRLCLGGAAELYHVRPDIACYGKAMSNGRGVSAVVGPERIMELLRERVFYSNTYNGDPYNCAHVLGTLITLQAKPDIYTHLWDVGKALKGGLNSLGLNCVGHAPRTAITPRDEAWLGVCRRAVKKGVVMDRPFYASMCHGKKEVKMTLDVVEEVLDEK